MKLKEFLMVCGDSDMTITDTQDKTLCSGSSPHKELAKYENWDIVDITTNGYEKIFVMIEKSKESQESSKGIMEMCAELIAEKDKRILLLEEELKRYQVAERDPSTYVIKGGRHCGKVQKTELLLADIRAIVKLICDTRSTLKNVLIVGNRPVKNTSKEDCYKVLSKLQDLYKSNMITSDEWFFESFLSQKEVIK